MDSASKLMTDKEELSPLPPRRARSFPLRDTRDCQRLLAKLANQVLRGEIDANIATKVAYLLSLIMRGMEEARGEDIDEESQTRQAAFQESCRRFKTDHGIIDG